MLSIFNQPTPLYTDVKKNLIRHFLVGCFIALFLIIFQPFGTASIKMDHKIPFLSGYGIISFLVFSIVFIGLPRLFPKTIVEEKWVVWKQILLLITALSLTLLVSYIYQALWFGWTMTPSRFFGFFITVLPICIFPCVFIAMLDYIYQLQKHQTQANNFNQQVKPIPSKTTTTLLQLKDENDKLDFTLPLDQLVFIKAANNYVEINYLENEQIKKYLLRNSIRNIETQLAYPSIKRCHRSYLVNMDKAGRITGNAQGYKIHFPFTVDFVVPVSRGKGKELLAILK